MDHRDSPPFVRGHHRGKCSGKHDKRKYYEEKIIDRRTNQDCTESGRRLGNGRFEKALSQQNAPAVIAALVKQSAAQLLIDRDSLPAIIDKTTALADRSGNPVEQSLLRLLTAQMYNLYLDRNYQIRWRDEIDDFSLPVESWSKNMFTEK